MAKLHRQLLTFGERSGEMVDGSTAQPVAMAGDVAPRFASLVDEDHDAEGDEPHAPEHVADEVRLVDAGEVERREHADEHQDGRRRRPTPGTSDPRSDDRVRRRRAPSTSRSAGSPSVSPMAVPRMSLTVVNESRAELATLALLLAASDA